MESGASGISTRRRSLMVMPGVTMRKASVKVLELGRLALLMACHAISIAITVVLPAPVASFMARRNRPGLAASLWAVMALASSWVALFFGATSVSQMMVSAAST